MLRILQSTTAIAATFVTGFALAACSGPVTQTAETAPPETSAAQTPKFGGEVA